ncbi:MAG: hypothetical protein ACFFD4_38655 [Candidatus Odinarchaeota archaeon]
MSGYEFTKEQDAVINSLNKRMLLSALVIFIGGVATLVEFMVDLRILLLVNGVLYCVMAVTFILPTDNLRKIVKTEGSDIKELMQAMNELGKGWLIVNIITLLSCIVLTLGLVEVLLQP